MILPQLLVDLGQLLGSQPELALGADLVADVGEMAAKVADCRGLPVASADVDLDGADLAVRGAHPHDQAQRLASLESFAQGVLGAATIVGMNDVEKRLLL